MVPFLDVDTSVLILGAIAFFAGGAVKGVVGIGLPPVVVSVLATVADLPTAVAVMFVPVMASNLLQAYQGGNLGHTLSRFWPLLLPMIVATAVAAQFLARIDVTTGALVLGLIVIAFVASQAFPEIKVGLKRIPVIARAASPSEFDQLWKVLIKACFWFPSYQQGTERNIPIVVLEPARLNPVFLAKHVSHRMKGEKFVISSLTACDYLG